MHKPVNFLIIFCLLFFSCGYLEELNLLANQQVDGNADDEAPTIISVNPPAGSKIDDTISYIEITYSEEVDGAGNAGNYSLSGAGVGSLSLGGVADQGDNTYRITVSGTPGDASLTLNIQNVVDLDNNALTDDTINYLGWWDTDWLYRRRLTFDNSAQTQDLTDFPVLIRLNSLRINYARTQNSGEDIRFLDEDRSILNYEIEDWDESGESIVWVKVPTIDQLSNDDFIWMYYGNSSVSAGEDAENVWDDNYVSVHHLSDTPSGSGDVIDSTSNGWHGTAANMDASDQVNGYIGGALDFDGTNEWINPDDEPDRGFFHDDFSYETFEVWFKCDTTGGVMTIFDEGGSTNGFYLGINSNTLRTVAQDNQDKDVISSAFTDTSNYYYLVGAYNYNVLIQYLNGVQSTTSTAYTSISSHSGEPGFGSSPDSNGDDGGSGEYFNGILDEIRLSDIVRSADWIAAQYLSMNDSFVTFSNEE